MLLSMISAAKREQDSRDDLTMMCSQAMRAAQPEGYLLKLEGCHHGHYLRLLHA